MSATTAAAYQSVLSSAASPVAAHVRLSVITVDTDTTVHTVYGRQMGARKSYNPKTKGKKSYQLVLTFIAADSGVGTSSPNCGTIPDASAAGVSGIWVTVTGSGTLQMFVFFNVRGVTTI